MGAIASQITSITIVYSTVDSDADQKTSKDRWIPAQWASYVENISIWWRHHANVNMLSYEMGPILLTCFNFNSTMYK